MKQVFLIISLLATITSGYCQYDFLFQKKNLKDVQIYEDSLKSNKIGFVKRNVSKDYFPTAKENHTYYPLSYIRTNDTFFPTLHIEYYYNETDSTLLATSYDWNIMDYVSNIKTDGNKFEIEKKRENEYLKKYKEIKEYLISKFGRPTSTEEDKSSSNYFYRLTWKENDIDVLVLLKFSTQLTYLPGDMIVGSFNIRVKVNYNQ